MFKLTLDYVYKNLNYDLISDGVIKYFGNIDYVSSHFGDCLKTNKLVISDNQPIELKEFARKYKQTKISNPELTIEQFFKTY